MFVERKPPLVVGPVIETQADYFVMLHELGHVFWGHTQGAGGKYFTNGVLKSEVQAWEHALQVASEPPTKETKKLITAYLDTYVKEAMQSKGRLWRLARPKFPGEGIAYSPAFRFDSLTPVQQFVRRLNASA